MSLKRNLVTALSVIVGLFGLAGLASAQDSSKLAPATPDTTVRTDRGYGHDRFGGEHRGHRMGGPMGMLRGITLTEDQKQQLHTIFESNKPTPESMEESRTLFEAKRAGTLTADQQSRLDALRAERQERGRAMHDQIMNLLTPDQKAQLEQRKAEMKQRMQERHERWQQRKQEQQDTPAATTDTKDN